MKNFKDKVLSYVSHDEMKEIFEDKALIKNLKNGLYELDKKMYKIVEKES